MSADFMTEDAQRGLLICAGCGKPKAKGLVVCWPCFKYRDDVTPLKYFGGAFVDWLKMIKTKGGQSC